jgi:hypothetical protein
MLALLNPARNAFGTRACIGSLSFGTTKAYPMVTGKGVLSFQFGPTIFVLRKAQQIE